MRRAAGASAKRSVRFLAVSHKRVLIWPGESTVDDSATWRTICSNARGSKSDAGRCAGGADIGWQSRWCVRRHPCGLRRPLQR